MTAMKRLGELCKGWVYPIYPDFLVWNWGWGCSAIVLGVTKGVESILGEEYVWAYDRVVWLGILVIFLWQSRWWKNTVLAENASTISCFCPKLNGVVGSHFVPIFWVSLRSFMLSQNPGNLAIIFQASSGRAAGYWSRGWPSDFFGIARDSLSNHIRLLQNHFQASLPVGVKNFWRS